MKTTKSLAAVKTMPPEAERCFTTFQVAKICGVFHTTVINWANKGKLKCRVTPGGHRRISPQDLVEFMRRYDMPIPKDLHPRPRRVLVVDDEPVVHRIVKKAMGKLKDVEVEVCSNGVEALIQIGKDAPDLVVLDIRMPGMDGLAVLKVLRSSEHTRPIRVIAMSGADVSREEEETLHEYADAFFHKPLSTDEFVDRARECLDMEAGARRG